MRAMSGRGPIVLALGLVLVALALVWASFQTGEEAPRSSPAPTLAAPSPPPGMPRLGGPSIAQGASPSPVVSAPPSSEAPKPTKASLPPPGAETALKGLSTRELTAQDRLDLKLPERLPGGVVVQEVDPTSPAAEAHLALNDVIVQANGEKVLSLDDLRRAIGENNFTKIRVYRRGSPFEVVIYKPYHPPVAP